MDKTERRRWREVVFFSLSFVFSLFLESDLNVLERLEALVFFSILTSTRNIRPHIIEMLLHYERMKKLQ